MSIKASLPHSVAPPIFEGDTLIQLFQTVEQAERASPSPVASGAGVGEKSAPRDYFRCTELPPQSELHCINIDCQRKARLLIDARDEDVKPFCEPCAYVEFAHWMVGV